MFNYNDTVFLSCIRCYVWNNVQFWNFKTTFSDNFFHWFVTYHSNEVKNRTERCENEIIAQVLVTLSIWIEFDCYLWLHELNDHEISKIFCLQRYQILSWKWWKRCNWPRDWWPTKSMKTTSIPFCPRFVIVRIWKKN